MSVIRRYCVETAKHIIKLFYFAYSHTMQSSFSTPNIIAIFRRGPPNGGIECMGYEKSRLSTSVSLYLGNDTRQP